MTKFGAHVVQGQRNGYGELCSARPSVVLSHGDGGALVEAKQKSGGRTVTIFRHTVWPDSPNLDNATEQQSLAMADSEYPKLKAQWDVNPADYYQVLNEPGGNDELAMRNYSLFESRIIQLAEADGFKLCVANLAGGTPGDIELWKRYWMPLVQTAWAGEHIYGRHAYGGDLVDSNNNVIPGNPSRPFDELSILRSYGYTGKMVITECGLNGGYGYVGDDHFMSQMTGYDLECMKHEEIIGFCAWTLGNWNNANWQSAIPLVIDYINNGPSNPNPPQPPLPTECRGRPRVQYERVYFRVSDSATLQQWLEICELAYQNRNTVGFSADDAMIGDLDYRHVIDYGFQYTEAELNSFRDMYYPGVTIEYSEFVNEQTDFMAEVWPTEVRVITQEFGANPEYYGQFGLPGHEGIDFAAPHQSRIYSIAGGIVSDLRISPTGHNYGRFVRVYHGNGYESTYAHLDSIAVMLNQQITAGQLLGGADSTGNSTGSHLHLTLKKRGATANGDTNYPYDIIDPTPSFAHMINNGQGSPNAKIGLHATATGRLVTGEASIFQTSRAELVKVLSSTAPEDIAILKSVTNASTWVIRAYLDFRGGRVVTPSQFVSWTVDDVYRTIQAIGSNNKIYIELHNEPNLYDEGFGYSWNMNTFNSWMNECLDQYRLQIGSEFDFVFPGLSPGGAVPNVRYDSHLFLSNARQSIDRFNSVGVHAYWAYDFPMSSALSFVDEAVSIGKPVVVTEASNNKAESGSVKGNQYVSFWNQLKTRPNIIGVSYYISSAAPGTFDEEVWVKNGVSTGIAEVVGSR